MILTSESIDLDICTCYLNMVSMTSVGLLTFLAKLKPPVSAVVAAVTLTWPRHCPPCSCLPQSSRAFLLIYELSQVSCCVCTGLSCLQLLVPVEPHRTITFLCGCLHSRLCGSTVLSTDETTVAEYAQAFSDGCYGGGLCSRMIAFGNTSTFVRSMSCAHVALSAVLRQWAMHVVTHRRWHIRR